MTYDGKRIKKRFVSESTSFVRESQNSKKRHPGRIPRKQKNLFQLSPMKSLEINNSQNQVLTKRGKKKKSQDELVQTYKDLHSWLEYKEGKLFCNYCIKYTKEQNMIFVRATDKVFISTGSKNIKIYTLTRHADSELHGNATLKHGTIPEKLKVEMKRKEENKHAIKLQDFQEIKNEDKPMLSLFQIVYFSVNLFIVPCSKKISKISAKMTSFLLFNIILPKKFNSKFHLNFFPHSLQIKMLIGFYGSIEKPLFFLNQPNLGLTGKDLRIIQVFLAPKTCVNS